MSFFASFFFNASFFTFAVDIFQLVGIPSSCVIVKCDWLVECAKANRLISTSNYLISVEADNESSEENHTLMNSSPTASDVCI